MSARSGPVRAARASFVAAVLALPAGCGLPSGGDVQRVDDDTVPYHLLDPGSASSGSETLEGHPGPVPLVFWVDGDRLVPEAAGASCDESSLDLARQLLDVLAGGPSDESRAAGRASAIPPDSGLDLVGVADGTAQVDFDPQTSLSAERLPMAVGEIVLTLSSIPGVESVRVVTDGQAAPVPLPGGALTDGPVTAEDYADFLPDRLATPDTAGCPA